MTGASPEQALTPPFLTAVSQHVWRTKYQHRVDGRPVDATIEDTWRRIATALAAVEPEEGRKVQSARFHDILQGFRFLPGGRIQAGAGVGRNVTLFNCFVTGTIEDSMEGIFRALHEGAITMQQGGGIGCDFSTLRPRGARARGVDAIASGPVSFMALWDAMCETILSTGARRGAMIATLRCDHPDVEEFVAAKQRSGRLRHFNLSVLISDAFMAAIRSDGEWPLVFPAPGEAGDGDTLLRDWPGFAQPVACRVHRRVRARDLWRTILRATYDYAEPGVLFVDRINRLNTLWYRERITATNPCGEIPLPPYGACDLGSLNLTRFVEAPFTPAARLDEAGIAATTGVATRLLDNVIDASRFPFPQQRDEARGARRIGLGITGLGDALIMLGLAYGSEEARDLARRLMRLVCHTAYRTSVALAREKGAFAYFDAGKFLEGPFIRALPDDLQDAIARHGIRNSHLIAIAPTGTISLLANNVSSGLEPVFAGSVTRRVLDAEGGVRTFAMDDYALALWRRETGRQDGFPPAFVSCDELGPRDHLAMQAALQPHVDNSISKTINIPEDYPFESFADVYDLAYDLGLKGCTTFRPNPVTGMVITPAEQSADTPHCCVIEREAD